MKRKSIQLSALLLSVLLIAGSLGTIAYARAGLAPAQLPAPEASETPSGALLTAAGEAPEKDETVYIFTGADGSVSKLLVSDWLKNPQAEATLADRSELRDIEVVKGEASFTQGEDHSLLWDTQGQDVWYRGQSDREPPVTMEVSYLLDGEPIQASELAGKSGHVTIRFDYSPNETETVELEGRQQTLPVPYAMVTGLLLDDQVFSNVSVTNGRLVQDGSRFAVVGLAFPGLREALGLEEDQLEIPESLEIQADVKDFSMGMSVSLATNEVFSRLPVDRLNNLDSLSQNMDQLREAMDQLKDGSSRLYEGLDTLLEKSGALTEGVDQLAKGASQLNSGAAQLNSGAAQLQSGAQQLSSGLSTLDANSAALNNGAAQVFDSLLSAARTQLNAAGLEVPQLTVSNYEQVLLGVINSLDKDQVYAQALETVTQAVKAKEPEIRQQVAAAVKPQVEAAVEEGARAQVTAQVEAALRQQITQQVQAAVEAQVRAQVIRSAAGMSPEDYAAAVAAGLVSQELQEAVEAAIAQQLASQQVQDTIAAQVEAQMDSETVRALAAQKVEEQMNSETVRQAVARELEARLASQEVQAIVEENTQAQIQKAIADTMAGPEVQAQLSAAAQGAQQVIGLKSSLDSYRSFYQGLKSYTAGVTQAAQGAKALNAGSQQLKTGASQLSSGADQLSEGLNQLQGQLPALTDGVTQLRDGAKALSEGLERLDREAVEKLLDAAAKLPGLGERLQALAQMARNRRSFSGSSEELTGQVKYIYRTEGIGE